MLPYRGIDICDDLTFAAHFDADVSNQKFMTLAKAREILQTSSKVRAAAYFINTPTLILSSEGPLNDHEAISLFHKGLNTKESRHIFFKYSSHDLLNGRRQNKAFKLILNWLNTGYKNEVN
jgi:esterase/lipase